MSRIYFSADIETNGLIAGLNSMISLGVAAIDLDTGEVKSTFKVNIEPVFDLFPDISTMQWWTQHQEAYQRSTENAVPASEAMDAFVTWVNSFKLENPVLVTWKPGFDAAFIRYYMVRFGNNDVFGRFGTGLDLKTVAAMVLNQPFSETRTERIVGSDWCKPAPGQPDLREGVPHDALWDALNQAYMMYNFVHYSGSKI